MVRLSAVSDNDPEDHLKKEGTHATELLAGKVVKRLIRNRLDEVVIEFDDGSRIFVDIHEDQLDISIT